MGAIFGKKSVSPKTIQKSRITDNDRVIFELKKQRDRIKQYQISIEHKLNDEKEKVRQLIKDNKKDRALLILKKKKYMESVLERTDAHLSNIEEMVATIQTSEMQVDIMKKLEMGNETLRELNKALSVKDIEDILDETKDIASQQREISQLLSNQGDQAIVFDEQQILEELEQLIGEDKFAKVPDVSHLITPVGEAEEETIEIPKQEQVASSERQKVEAS